MKFLEKKTSLCRFGQVIARFEHFSDIVNDFKNYCVEIIRYCIALALHWTADMTSKFQITCKGFQLIK